MISMETESWLADLLARVDGDHDMLSRTDKAFLADVREKYEENGSNIWLSPKMIAWLSRIETKAA